MATLSPQGALLALCISRLPERSLPRHAWAAEVLIEQLWACAAEDDGGGWKDVLIPLVFEGGVDARRVRAEVWKMAQSGALVPVGVGGEARFEVADGVAGKGLEPGFLSPQRDRVVDFAVGQLTARLLAFSKTASACG